MKTIFGSLPTDILAQNVIALGKTGAGKSSALRILVEFLLDADKPVCIIDPKGDWWGLRLSKDGKGAGFPIVVFGGKHADIPISEHAGAAVAELFAIGKRSMLIDVSEFMVGERTRFFMDFAATLFKQNAGVKHLVIDEVHNFAPQGKVLNPDAGKMLHWANRIANEGRGKGITMIAASQRPQKVHKDLLTSCETLIAMRVIHVLDRGAVKDWIDGAGDRELGRKIIDELAGMPRGDGWVWSPEIKYGPTLVRFPMFETYDSFKPQERAGNPQGWSSVNLEEIKAKLVAVTKEAEENDPKRLKAEIARLTKMMDGKTFDSEPQLTAAQVDRLRHEGWVQGYDKGKEGGFKEGRERAMDQIRAWHRNNDTRMFQLLANILEDTQEVRRLANEPPTPADIALLTPEPIVTDEERKALLAPARKEPKRAAPPTPKRDLNSFAAAVPKPEGGWMIAGGKRRMLSALAQYPQGLSAKRLGLLIDMQIGSGTWRNYLAELRKREWIVGGGEQIAITPAGLEALGEWDPLPTGAKLIQYWSQRLGNSKKREMFDIIVAEPNGITAEGLAKRVDMQIGSGTWRNYLAELRGLGIVVGTKHNIKVAPELYQ